MSRPKTKTVTTTIKLTPEMRELWDRVATHQHRTRTNAFESLLLEYGKQYGLLEGEPRDEESSVETSI